MKKISRIFICFLLTAGMILPSLASTISADEAVSVEIIHHVWMEEDFWASQNSQEGEYTSSEGTSLPYLLYVPDNYDPEKSYPLVLSFHGAGERGDDNTHIFRGGNILQRLLLPEELEKHPCIILAPQCASDSQWVLYPWDGGVYDHTQIEKSPFMTAAEELLEVVIAQYSVDTSRLYVTGISMGGFATWDIISRNPDKFAAAIPICGGVDESYLENLKGFPIRTFHAIDDPTVSPAGTQKANEILNGTGDFLYTEYSMGGHGIWDRVHRTGDLMDWLFAQTLDNRTNDEIEETEPVTVETALTETTEAISETSISETDIAESEESAPAETDPADTENSSKGTMVGIIGCVILAVIAAAAVIAVKKKKSHNCCS